MALGLCGLLSTSACAAVQKLEKEAQADLKTVQDVKKGVDAAKKGDLSGAADSALEAAVKGALTKNAKTRTAAFNIEVKSGHVTLGGKVDGDVKKEAETVVKGVPGVSKVTFK
jgi:osmotically-inducible protein OsmY